jgi:peptide deformylase
LAILPITHYPAKILEVKCEKIMSFGHELRELLDNMYETMIAADGVGLAAPQIGVSQQIAIIDIGEEEEAELIELINPEIISQSGEEIDIEGCLSFPGLYGKVPRSSFVSVQAFNRFGKKFTVEADGFLARAIQHEIDHLHGQLFTSKVIEYIDESELDGSEEV